MWQILPMSEIWDLLNPNPNKTFGRPRFPCRRWGQSYTKESTTNRKELITMVEKLSAMGLKVRKRIHHEDTNRIQKRGTFYKVEIYKL